MKQQADAHSREVTFEVGDLVFLKLRPYHMKTLVARINEKLSPCLYGPYKIIDQIGPVAYRLLLPDSARIHSVFHVSQLCRSTGHEPTPSLNPPQLMEDLELLVEPEAVLGVKPSHTGFEVLIKWKGTKI